MEQQMVQSFYLKNMTHGSFVWNLFCFAEPVIKPIMVPKQGYLCSELEQGKETFSAWWE